MKLVKSQISNYKLQINPKLQNSNPKHISEYNEENRFGFLRKAILGKGSDRRKLTLGLSRSALSSQPKGSDPRLVASQDLFGSLELGIWILFVICYLVFVIFNIQRLRYFQIFCSIFSTYLWDTTLVPSLPNFPLRTQKHTLAHKKIQFD